MSTEMIAVNRVVEAFAEAWNMHDMNAFSELFAEDAEFVNVVGLWWKGRAEIKAAHEFTHQTMFKHSDLSIDEIATRFPVQEIAIARCRWKLEGHQGPDGEALPLRHGILVNILRKAGPTWRIIDSQNTDVIEGVLSRPQ